MYVRFWQIWCILHKFGPFVSILCKFGSFCIGLQQKLLLYIWVIRYFNGRMSRYSSHWSNVSKPQFTWAKASSFVQCKVWSWSKLVLLTNVNPGLYQCKLWSRPNTVNQHSWHSTRYKARLLGSKFLHSSTGNQLNTRVVWIFVAAQVLCKFGAFAVEFAKIWFACACFAHTWCVLRNLVHFPLLREFGVFWARYVQICRILGMNTVSQICTKCAKFVPSALKMHQDCTKQVQNEPNLCITCQIWGKEAQAAKFVQGVIKTP